MVKMTELSPLVRLCLLHLLPMVYVICVNFDATTVYVKKFITAIFFHVVFKAYFLLNITGERPQLSLLCSVKHNVSTLKKFIVYSVKSYWSILEIFVPSIFIRNYLMLRIYNLLWRYLAKYPSPIPRSFKNYSKWLHYS